MRAGTSVVLTRNVSQSVATTSMKPNWLSTEVLERRSEEKATVIITPAVVMVPDWLPIARKIDASVV
eukprot:1181243-Prymnesium_polylepis.3